MPAHFDPTEWTTTQDAAELTGYDYAHVRRLAREGRIKGMKVGRGWLVNRESIQTYAEKMKLLGSAKHDPTERTPSRGHHCGAIAFMG